MGNKIEAVIFDLGGTLINYEGIPHYWGDFYEQAFNHVSDKINIHLSEEQMNSSIHILKKYNTRLFPREIEYTPEHIFTDVFKGWNMTDNVFHKAISSFFEFFQKNVMIYPETVTVLSYLKERGYKIGILTDVPTGMPTELVLQDITTFKENIDYILTSVDCGYRKPNKRGIEMIAESFGVNIKNCVFVGNEEKDIQAAKNAGIKSILIHREEQNIDFGEDLQISNLTEIIRFLEKDLMA